jgi:hypothetical protein
MGIRTTATTKRARLATLAGIVGLSLALLAPASAAAAGGPEPTGTGDDAGCPGHWPAAVQGKPATYAAGARAGEYLWHDARGWHLRVTKVNSERAVFTGRIKSDRPMTVSGVLLEEGDRITLSADRLTLSYRFANYGHIDGLDFRTACATRLDITGAMNGATLPASRVWIGANGRHPLGVPFAILRAR